MRTIKLLNNWLINQLKKKINKFLKDIKYIDIARYGQYTKKYKPMSN